MRAPRGARVAALAAGVLLLPAGPALAQGDSALGSWEPAAITRLELPRAESLSRARVGRGFTIDALQGPPTPATMYAIASLDRDQLYRYAAAYRAHMNATWDARAGVASSVRLLRQAVERRDEDAARYYGAIAERLWSRVVEEDQGFDDVVESLLRKGQRKQYHEWKQRLARGEAEEGRLEREVASPG